MPTKKNHFKSILPAPAVWLSIAALSALLTSCSERAVLHGDSGARGKHLASVVNDLSGADTTSDAQRLSVQESVKIWFVKEQGGELQPIPVERTLSSQDPIKDATDQLLRGPTRSEQDAGIRSEIPLGTVILGVEKKGPITELNLSQRFASGGTSSVEARLSQLERTIKDVAGKSKVFLDVEGHRLLTAGDGMEVKQPIN